MSTNTGHGHVSPRPDGVRARCGGPGLCQVCNREKAALTAPATPESVQDQFYADTGYDWTDPAGDDVRKVWLAGRASALALPLSAEAVTGPSDQAEPIAWFAFADSNGPVPLELWGWDKKACLHAVLENARSIGWKGTVNGYLLDQRWSVRPVWLHPYAAPDAQPVSDNGAAPSKLEVMAMLPDTRAMQVVRSCLDHAADFGLTDADLLEAMRIVSPSQAHGKSEAVAYPAIDEDDFESLNGPLWPAVFAWKTADPGRPAGDAAKNLEATVIRLMRAYVDADRAQRPAAQVKDHDVAQAVNALRDIAIEFHGAQQLRERIAGVVLPLVGRLRPAAPADGAALAEQATISKVEWIAEAKRYYLAAGDDEATAMECARAMAREQDWSGVTDDIGDPFDIALEDIQGRAAPAPAQGDAAPAVPDEWARDKALIQAAIRQAGMQVVKLDRHIYRLEPMVKAEAQVFAAPQAGPAHPDAADTDLWYLQDTRSFIGNDVVWWARDGNGYTTDLRQAQAYSRESAFRQAAMRGCDRAWPKAYIDGKSRPAVDFQHIDHDAALPAEKGGV